MVGKGSGFQKIGWMKEESIKMRKESISLLGILLISFLLIGCNQEPPKPEGALSVAELLENPICETQTRVHGEVSALRELTCTCFFLQSEEGYLSGTIRWLKMTGP
jgi:hypothetical protein